LLTVEALEILALKPGATPSEIKEAYRDLVKVWHPDRFATDLRLREKAEFQIKLINEAYRVLQAKSDANSGVSGTYGAASAGAANSSSRDSHRRRNSPSTIWPNSHHGWNGKVRVASLYIGVGILAILLVGYFAVERGGGSSQPFASQHQHAAASSDGQIVHAAKSSGSVARSKAHAKDPSPSSFTVRSLSDAQSDRLKSLCSRQKALWGKAAYQSCLKAQLDWMMNSAGKPDLSALSEAERESVQSVCSAARRFGQDRYNQCETEQVASLAAEPARPDVSSLNHADRRAIESACANVKNQEGPAAYHRCLDRFMKTLAEVK
jgi:curved DNA-binding protein CbpA